MNWSLHGKSALVCGSTAGIGKATALALANAGASVTLMARSEAKLKATLAELSAGDGQSHDYLVADFSEPQNVRQTVEQALADHNWTVLINNTGGPPGGPILDASAEAFLAGFNAHLVNNHALVQLLTPRFKREKFGRVVNIISTSVKAPIPGLGVSNTIRGAVASWAKTLAGELGSFGVTVNNVLPGFTDTDRLGTLFEAKAKKLGTTLEAIRDDAIAGIPAGRIGSADEIAAAVLFLASPAASYVNGINLPVDGGRLPTL